MSRTKVKICGVTTAEDAAAAVAAGADAIGVIFAPSKRQVTIPEAAQVFRGVPAGVARIGVFVDAQPQEVEAAVAACSLDAVEFSGEESPESCMGVSVPVIKTLHVGEDFDLAIAMRPYEGAVWAFLLDTAAAGARGGTGVIFDWRSVAPLPEYTLVFVAGGLNPDNVADAVRALRPHAVDVSSGVEASPGEKDHDKVRAFISAVAEADAEGER